MERFFWFKLSGENNISVEIRNNDDVKNKYFWQTKENNRDDETTNDETTKRRTRRDVVWSLEKPQIMIHQTLPIIL